MSDDLAEKRRRRLHYALEHEIRQVNTHYLGAALNPVTRAGFNDVARVVAELRAAYLKAVLEIGTTSNEGAPDPGGIGHLRQLREAYSEALEGFGALEHALERGYIELSA